MKVIVDSSLYKENCIFYEIDYENKIIFTFKTDDKIVNKITKKYNDFINKMKKGKNINKLNSNFVSNKDIEHRRLIYEILGRLGIDEDLIEQEIYENLIYKIEVWKQIRMFFLCENTIEKIIIKPLFLDLNHVIFNDNNFIKNYNICWICKEKICKWMG
ncbi:hypothetical protein [Spiroplasma poulsonii]|uniref:hypothetical protein n=2 Tax=Spiroplasma TaxID=2132 RepID=UPI001F4C55D0|nr:hypothetical protein [Spiroplasma poulsonii]MBH8623394.1 hypothetical protein [Spiroplasma sp. hyd1]UNF62495.1 hypothetical protein MNU24_03285 [Spiroplasma poulsonii]